MKMNLAILALCNIVSVFAAEAATGTATAAAPDYTGSTNSTTGYNSTASAASSNSTVAQYNSPSGLVTCDMFKTCA